MKITPTPLDGLVVIETTAHADARGRFERVFCTEELARVRAGLRFVQVNLSTTRRRGTVRGMHFQLPPLAEAKLVRCLRGEVHDVAVDLRRGSPTFLQWHAVRLAGDASRQVFIPEGFAHGFQALTDDVELLYMHTAPWSRDAERRLRHDDPRLAIAWPLPVTDMSDADRTAPALEASFAGVDA